MALALYAGTFDPPTLGHVDIVARALALFESVEVTIAVNAEKRTLLSGAERADLFRASLADVEGADRVVVTEFEGLLVDRARASGADVLVRGIRGSADFDYEMRMAMANRRLAPGLETIFLAPEPEHQFISSTIVRDVHRWGGDTSSFVPTPVEVALRQRRG